MESTQPTFSVLICTYQRPEMLRQALHALIEQTDEKPDEVIVVNGGDESADQVVGDFMGGPVTVKLVKTENVNLATSRNVGLPHCRGVIVAMTDDDAEVYPDWVTQMKRIHAEQPAAGGVGGAVIGADSQRDFISRLSDVMTFSSPPEPASVRTLPGVNVSYKSAALEAVGFQDESLFRGEDVDFNWRIKQAGYEIYYHPAIKVIHHHRPTLKQFLTQHHMYGRAYYLVRRKWPEMYAVYPRHLKTFRNWLKGIHFFVAIFYQPFTYASKLSRLGDKLLALPVLLALQVVWKGGMITERINQSAIGE